MTLLTNKLHLFIFKSSYSVFFTAANEACDQIFSPILGNIRHEFIWVCFISTQDAHKGVKSMCCVQIAFPGFVILLFLIWIHFFLLKIFMSKRLNASDFRADFGWEWSCWSDAVDWTYLEWCKLVSLAHTFSNLQNQIFCPVFVGRFCFSPQLNWWPTFKGCKKAFFTLVVKCIIF